MVDLIINILAPPQKKAKWTQETFQSDKYYVYCGDGDHSCINVSKLIKFQALHMCNSLHTDYTYLNKVTKILSNEQMEEKPPERMITQKSRENVLRNGRR